MNDKKDYQSILKLLDGVSKIEATANKLGQLGVDAEDPQVKEAATKLAGWLRSLPASGQGSKQRLIDMAKSLAAGSNDVMKAHGAAILKLEAYCHKMVASTRPQWQEIALAHGWAPPPATLLPAAEQKEVR